MATHCLSLTAMLTTSTGFLSSVCPILAKQLEVRPETLSHWPLHAPSRLPVNCCPSNSRDIESQGEWSFVQLMDTIFFGDTYDIMTGEALFSGCSPPSLLIYVSKLKELPPRSVASATRQAEILKPNRVLTLGNSCKTRRPTRIVPSRRGLQYAFSAGGYYTLPMNVDMRY